MTNVTHARSTRTNATYAVSLLVVAAAALTGCGSSDNSGSKDPLKGDTAKGGTVVVGFNNFPESILLADIYGEALKAKGVKVSYKLNIGSRETTYGLIKNGTITVLPEYNGALLAYLNAKAAPTTSRGHQQGHRGRARFQADPARALQGGGQGRDRGQRGDRQEVQAHDLVDDRRPLRLGQGPGHRRVTGVPDAQAGIGGPQVRIRP